MTGILLAMEKMRRVDPLLYLLGARSNPAPWSRYHHSLPDSSSPWSSLARFDPYMQPSARSWPFAIGATLTPHPQVRTEGQEAICGYLAMLWERPVRCCKQRRKRGMFSTQNSHCQPGI